MKIEQIEIGPELAGKLLLKNTANRKIKQHQVESLAIEMKEGRWLQNGDAIRFTGDMDTGRLIDGQHRLMAVVKSNTVQRFTVVTFLPEDAFMTIDTGSRRSVSDSLMINGLKNSALLASSVRRVLAISERYVGVPRKMGAVEVMEFISVNPSIMDSIPVGKEGSLLAVSSLVALHFLFSRKSKAEADSFFNLLFTGIGLDLDNPIYALRQRLIKMRTMTNFDVRTSEHLAISAWNLMRSKSKRERLVFRKDQDDKRLPEII